MNLSQLLIIALRLSTALAGATALPAAAQTLSPQAPPKPIARPRLDFNQPIARPAAPALSAVQRTLAAKQLTGSPTLDASAAPIHFAAWPVLEGWNDIGFIYPVLVRMGVERVLLRAQSQVGIQVRSSMTGYGKGLHLFVCAVAASEVTWSAHPVGSGGDFGGTVPVIEQRATFVVDLSTAELGSISVSAKEDFWAFDYCDVTPLKGG